MGPDELARQIRAGESPNVPPDWWPDVRELITEGDEAAYHDRARARWQRHNN